jgi:sortase A
MASKTLVRKKDKFRLNYRILFGTILLSLAIVIFIATFSPVIKSELNYQLNVSRPQNVFITPVDPDFSIIIPKINANAKVIKNVDPFNSKLYQQALTQGVAHAKNTALPGATGNIFIFAHSAGNWYEANQYNAVFYLLNKLIAGDEIDIYYQAKKYKYSVSEIKFVKGNDISYLSNSSKKDQLTLMTCWPPGTTLRRLIVIADLVNAN